MIAVSERWRNNQNKEAVLSAMFSYDQMIFFDLETTSLSAKTGRVIELAAIRYEIGEGTAFSEIGRLHVYINPNMPLPEKIVELTGITNAMLCDKPEEQEVFGQIKAFFDGTPVLCGYNVGFDIGFLEQMYLRNSAILGEHTVIDVLEMARDALDVPKYSLGAIAEELGILPEGSLHSAMTDIETNVNAFRLFWNGYFVEKEEPERNKLQPKVYCVRFWEGYKGFSRIYVETSAGTVYYDVRRKYWGNKNADFGSLDMAFIEQQAWTLIGVDNQNDFGKYKGPAARLP